MSDDEEDEKDDCGDEWEEGDPIEWLNSDLGSFDDFGSSMLILYIAATGDGWEEFMFAGMDAIGVGVAATSRG